MVKESSSTFLTSVEVITNIQMQIEAIYIIVGSVRFQQRDRIFGIYRTLVENVFLIFQYF